MIGKYIGGKKISDEQVTKETTPRGSSILEVTFDDGTHGQYPGPMFGEIQTDEASEPSDLQKKRIAPVVREILDVFAEYDVKLQEIDYIEAVVKMSLEYNYQNATKALWGTEEKTWLDMYRVLKSHGITPAEESDNVTNPAATPSA